MEIIQSTNLTVNEAANLLKVTPQQIRSMCRDGKLVSEKFGNSWVVSRESVNNLYHNSCTGKTHDNMPPISGVRKSHKRPVALSFFSGAMGMDIGITNAGFNLIFASEIDNASRKTILKNHPEIALVGDIREYTGSEIRALLDLGKEEIDLVIGGPPCQAFSTAGKRKGFEDERGNVFLKFIEMIIELQPRYAVIENVRGLLSAPLYHRPLNQRGINHPKLSSEEMPGGALKYIIGLLESAGYGVSFNLYNAANFGTPQKRERVVILCSRDGTVPPHLEPTHSEKGEFGLKPWVPLSIALKDWKKIEHDYVKFPEKRLRFYRLLKEGENWRNLSPENQKIALGAAFNSGGGKSGFYRRLAWDKPSPTLVTHPAMPATDLAHPEELRPLSIQEYKWIQQFPDDWHIEGSLVEKYRQIGNAVPVGLGEAIGRHIMKLLNGEAINQIENFNFSRYRNTSKEEWLHVVS